MSENLHCTDFVHNAPLITAVTQYHSTRHTDTCISTLTHESRERLLSATVMVLLFVCLSPGQTSLIFAARGFYGYCECCMHRKPEFHIATPK